MSRILPLRPSYGTYAILDSLDDRARVEEAVGREGDFHDEYYDGYEGYMLAFESATEDEKAALRGTGVRTGDWDDRLHIP